MKPHKYTEQPNGDIIFHYTFSELREFLTFGKESGTNGVILTKRYSLSTGGILHQYRGFGIINNPCKTLNTIELVFIPEFDGELVHPDEIINPRIIPPINIESYRMIFLDMENLNMSDEELGKQIAESNSITSTREMTIEQIMEEYGDNLTEEGQNKLREKLNKLIK